MQIKVKLVDKENGIEANDFMELHRLVNEIEHLAKDKFPEYDCIVKVYGEIVPIRR